MQFISRSNIPLASNCFGPAHCTADDFTDWAESSGIEGALLEEVHQRRADASCKALFVIQLLDQLRLEGHRTLIFSQSRVMLDILQVRHTTQALAAGAKH